MNREQRRAAARRHRPAPIDRKVIEAAAACQDCHSDVTLEQDGNLWHAVVTHDDTCPFYLNRTR